MAVAKQKLRGLLAAAFQSLLILTWLGTAFAQDAATPAAGDAKAGAAVFKKCLACHRIGEGAKNAVGPVLNGVVGRKSASLPDYSYSAAMQKAGLTWDEATLTPYLHSPRTIVPGTKMTFAGLTSDTDVASIIAYLKTFGPDGKPAAP